MESESEIINLESTCTVCRFRPDGSFLFKALDELGNLGIGKTLTLAQVPGPNGVEGKCITGLSPVERPVEDDFYLETISKHILRFTLLLVL